MMENLYQAILDLFDDYTQPSAAGAAYPTPWLWPEEAHADAAVYEEQKRLNAMYGAAKYDVPKWLYRKRKVKQDRGFEVDRKALIAIMREYDERLVVRLKTKPYHVEEGRVIERALVSLADDAGWEMTEPENMWPRTTDKKVFRIR